MKTIHKHILVPNMSVTQLELPHDVEFLTVQKQGNQIVLWESHSPNNLAPQLFEVFAIFTGVHYPIPEGSYINTVQLESGLVLHYFYREA